MAVTERRKMVKKAVYLWVVALLGSILLPLCSTQGELHVEGYKVLYMVNNKSK